jgi:SAM-dependent MidA family methyltransferase
MIRWMEERIRESGPVPFSTFMEWALYDPDFGYYTSDHMVFGAQGDFYTSPGVHSVFSETLAEWILAKWTDTSPSDCLRIVEMGAGTGQLAQGIIRTLVSKSGNDPSAFSYSIVERSTHLQHVQRQRLSEFASYVSWQSSLADLEKADTFFLSNELLDAFPVELVRKQHGNWEMQYIYFDTEKNALEPVWYPLDEHKKRDWDLEHLGSVEEGCICEIRTGLKNWVQEVDRIIRCGFVLTIDYGGDTEELYGLHHPEGTIRSYSKHHVSGHVLETPGLRDLTADVDFSYLESCTTRFGWIRERYETQGQFLIHAGILSKLQDSPNSYNLDDPIRKTNMAIKHLILPGGMGDAFRVTLHRLPVHRR